MSKLDQAVQIVSETMDKEVALTKIMQANNTYRSNALTYYKKALARLGKTNDVLTKKIEQHVGMKG